jgi:hypothetical protein
MLVLCQKVEKCGVNPRHFLLEKAGFSWVELELNGIELGKVF